MRYPQLPHEAARLQALLDLQILDTPPEARFDAITSAAQAYFKSTSALISLLGEDRQWFKSKQGLATKETPRDISFCTYAIAEEAYLLVPDALKDDRFANNPLVKGPPFIRAYAGIILHSADGYELGTLCVLFDEARDFTDEDVTMLRHFGDLVESEMNPR